MAYRDQELYGQSRQGQGNPYSQQPYGDVERGQGFQMSDMNGRGGNAEQDPNYLLNELSALEYDIDNTLLSVHIQNARDAQKKAIIERESSKAADALSNVAVAYAKELQLRLVSIVRNPRSREPRNRPTVERLKRKLEELLQDFMVDNTAFQKKSTNLFAERLRTVDPSMSVEDSRRNAEVLLNGGQDQAFSDALMRGNRQGESATAFRAVQARSQEIQYLLRQFTEVNQLSIELNTLVKQQDPVVAQINEQSEVVHENVNQANQQLDGAIVKAKAANRKKWYCLALIIIIIIIIVVLVVKLVVNK